MRKSNAQIRQEAESLHPCPRCEQPNCARIKFFCHTSLVIECGHCPDFPISASEWVTYQDEYDPTPYEAEYK